MSDLRSPEPGPNPWPMKLLHFLMREWPYLAMLVLALFGVAYTSVTRCPMTLYWFALAPFIGFVCVLTRWPAMRDRDQRLNLVWTQVLHWGAVLAAHFHCGCSHPGLADLPRRPRPGDRRRCCSYWRPSLWSGSARRCGGATPRTLPLRHDAAASGRAV
jgi:hypothetical protein